MKTVEIPNGQLATWEVGAGRPVLLIHGAGTNGELWADDLADLASDCRIITYNRRGYPGSSPSPRDWAAHRDDAAALLEALDAAPAVVVGYSAGAIAALDLALERPDLVAGLVLLDPAFNLKRCVTPRFARVFLKTNVLRRLRGQRRALEYYFPYAVSYTNGGTAWTKSPPQRREKILASGDGVFADFGSGGGEHVDEGRLATIDVPVTIVDAKLAPDFLKRSKERIRANMPQARYVELESSGHAVAFDARDELYGLLRDAVAQRMAHS